MTCPLTQLPLSSSELYPCFALKNTIHDLLQSNPGIAPKPSSKFVSVAKAFERYESPLTSVINRGNMQILPKAADKGVKECSAEDIRTKLNCKFFSNQTAFITFPNPEEFLMFRATGSICIRNEGVFPVVLCSYQAENGRAYQGGEHTLLPGLQQGYDIKGNGWVIEVRSGDASTLIVYDFERRSGGKGNLLGMGV